MRIVSWNMDWHRRSPEQRAAAWRYLRDDVRADIALVQEAVPPPALHPVFLEGGIGGPRKWGSGVVVFRGGFAPIASVQGVWRGRPLGEPVRIDQSHPGTVAAARIESLGLTVVSAYGMGVGGYSSTTMLRILADLEPLLDDPRYGDRVVIAGDWNIGTWWSGGDKKYRDRDASILGVLEAFGFRDCVDQCLPADRGRLPECRCTYGDECRHVWTQRNSQHLHVAYQTDYFYATRDVSALLRDAWVWDQEAALALSDHAPLVADLNF